MEENSIKWIGYEYEHSEKTADWFWAVGIVALCIAIIAIIYNNTLFGVFIILAAALAMILGNRPPDIVDYALTPKGLMIGTTLYHYKHIHSFWVDTHVKLEPELLIKTKKNLSRLFVIPLKPGTVDPHEVRDYLLQVVREEHIEEPLSHHLMRKFGL